MPGPSAVVIVLSAAHRAELQKLVTARKTPIGLAARARIVLLASEGRSNSSIAEEVGCDVKTVRLWRARWAAVPDSRSLVDNQRSGRRPRVAAPVRAKLISLACERVDADDKRPTRVVWSQLSLQEALQRATNVKLSASEIGRILRARGIRPHRVRMWLNSQDPQFEQKIDAICRYYTDVSEDVVVLCIDEKRLFAHRRQPGLRPAGPNRDVRVNFDYSRHGSSNLIAALNGRNGEVYAECRDRRTADDIVAFMEAVAVRHPGKVVVIWDNLNIHHEGKDARWTKFNERHGGRFTFLHTPIHASWCNQVEIWFSVLERTALRHQSFATVGDINATALRFIEEWNRRAKPFRWRFRGIRDWHQAAWLKRSACPTARLLGRRRAHAQAA